MGRYPVDAVKTMTKIAAQAEKDKLEENDIRIPLDENSNDVTAFLAKQAVKATSKLKIRAIITDSYSGRTARPIWLLSVANIRYWLFVIRKRRCGIWLFLMVWKRSICRNSQTGRNTILQPCAAC